MTRKGMGCGLFVLILMLVFAITASAQGPQGATKPAKTHKVKTVKVKKGAPLYSVPKSQPWYLGGGPGPAGAGIK